MAKHFIIYKTTNKIDSKFYIGQHITDNLDDGYIGSGPKYFLPAVRKHGRENFVREILFDFDNFDEMNEKEKELVTEELVKDPMCYNVTLGGNGSWWYVNDRGLNPFFDPESQKKNSYHNREISLESIAAIHAGCRKGGIAGSATTNARVFDGEIPNGFAGKSHSTETRKAISEKMKNAQSGDRNSQSGKKWIHSTEEHKSFAVDKERVQEYLDRGWKLGRKLKF